MRLKLNFELNKPYIEVEYRKTFISYLKYCLSDVDEKYFKQYYDNTKKKNFTFSVFLPNPKKENDMFHLDSNTISFDISFQNDKDYFLFYSCFLRQVNKTFNIKHNQMKLISINRMNEQTIKNDCILVKTLSPICIVDHNHDLHDNKKDYYYSIDDKAFCDIFEEKTNLRIQPIDCKKVVITHYNISFPTTSGIFVLSGQPKDLERVYKGGIGNNTGQGFGMIKIL